MDPMNVIDLARQACLSAGVLVAPVLIVALAVGVFMSVLQAVTQVQDHAISFVPKLLAIGLVLFLLLPWMTDYFVEYAAESIRQIPSIVFGG